MPSNKEIRALYGSKAVVSRKGAFVLVHLDRPSRSTVRKRLREFDPGRFFCADCPLCQLLQESGVVVFDDSIFEDDEDESIHIRRDSSRPLMRFGCGLGESGNSAASLDEFFHWLL